MDQKTMRAFLKLLAACQAAEDYITELKKYDTLDLTTYLQCAIREANEFLPRTTYTGIEPDKLPQALSVYQITRH